MELMERRRILLNTPHINIVTGLQFVTDMVAPIESLVINFSPIQDLHGYDSPWPAGGGKNLLNASADTGSLNNVNYTKNGDGTYTVNGTANGTSSFVVGSIELTANTQYVVSGCPGAGSGSSYNVRIRDANYTVLGFDVGNGATITPTETKTYYYQITVVSGYSVSNLIFKPMICLSTASNPDYAHFAPYSNICPISGRTGLDVTITGKNLFDGILELGFINGTMGLDGVSNSYIRGKDYIPVEELTDYKISTNNANITAVFVYEYKADKSYNLTTNKRIDLSSYLTTDANTAYIRFRPGYQTTDTSIKFQVEEGTVATAYEPYQGTTYPISWQTEAGTVYGGTIDVTTGLLTVDRAMVDMGTLTWNRTTAYSAPVLYTVVAGKLKSNISMLCSVYKFSGNFGSASGFANGSENASIGSCHANGQIFVRDDSYTDTAAFKSAMSGVQLVYELATPKTYQLTPQQIRTVKGTNNLFSNSNGGVTVNYWTHLD